MSVIAFAIPLSIAGLFLTIICCILEIPIVYIMDNAAVGYAMVINMMATKETRSFFALDFVLVCIPEITLIGLGVMGVANTLFAVGIIAHSIGIM